MPYVMLPSYSKYYDADSGTQFDPVLDQSTGCYIAVAHLDDEAADHFAKRPPFEVLSDDEYLALSLPAPALGPGPSESGDPLTDQAEAAARQSPAGGQQAPDLSGPPPPKSN